MNDKFAIINKTELENRIALIEKEVKLKIQELKRMLKEDKSLAWYYGNKAMMRNYISSKIKERHLLESILNSLEELPNYSNVTRFEVINHGKEGTGREYTRYGIKVDEFSLQDEGQTLKIFLK